MLSREEMKVLLDNQTGLCISIFMPTYPAGVETRQNQIRFRNLIRDTENRLSACNLRPQEIKALLEPAHSLAGNALFWRRQGIGLAVFISAGLFRSYCLPIRFEEVTFIMDRFFVKPLLPLLREDEHFYIIALSQNTVRLMEGTEHVVREIDLEGIPKSLAEALSYDEPEKQVRFRAGTPGGGYRRAMISGHGPDIEDTKDNLLKYFRRIDRGLRNFLKDERAPLVFAGVEYLFPIYKDTNTHPCLMEKGIFGNPEGMSTENLHRQAWQIVAPYFHRAEGDALAQYRQSLGTGLASKNIEEIVAAAQQGRVGTLFVAVGHQQLGAFVSEGNETVLRQEIGPERENFLDSAAIQTFLNGGNVFVLPQEKMPGKEQLAAVFRY